jgi:hypothetical protein
MCRRGVRPAATSSVNGDGGRAGNRAVEGERCDAAAGVLTSEGSRRDAVAVVAALDGAGLSGLGVIAAQQKKRRRRKKEARRGRVRGTGWRERRDGRSRTCRGQEGPPRRGRARAAPMSPRGRTDDRRAATSCATIHGTTGSGSRCPPSAAWGRRSGRNRVGAAGGGWGAWATGAWRRCSMSGASVRGVPLPVRVEERSTVAVQGLSPCQTRRAAVALGVSSRTIGAKRYLRRWTRRCYPRAKLRPRQSTDRRSAGSQPPVAGERA